MVGRHRVGVMQKYRCRTFDSDMFTTRTMELLRNGHEDNIRR
jgi:hypothetical protein